MPENVTAANDNLKSEVAQEKPRDKDGHFIKTKTAADLAGVLEKQANVATTHDDKTLLDVHIGNPLRRITELLEEIKKQKAFSFNIRGSLGAAGIVVLLTTFGIFGGTRAFCMKGEQSHIGELTLLDVPEVSEDASMISQAVHVWRAVVREPEPVLSSHRLVLIEHDQTVYRVLGLDRAVTLVAGVPYIVTGDVDTCDQSIQLKSPEALQKK